MRFCPKCGSELDTEDMKFCPNCGCDVEAEDSMPEETEGTEEKTAAGEEPSHAGENTGIAVSGKMRFCPNCGIELGSEFMRFCPNCGCDVEAEDSVPEGAERTAVDEGTSQAGIIGKLKAADKKVKGLIAAGGVFFLIVIIALVTKKPTITLTDYIKDVKYDGYSGRASAFYSFDKDALKEDILKKKKSNAGTDSLAGDLIQLQQSLTISQNSELKNGDTFTITFDDDCRIFEDASYWGINLKNGEVKKKVKGLQEISNVQLSDDFLHLHVAGYKEEPKIEAELNKEDFYASFKKGVNKKLKLDEKQKESAYNCLANNLEYSFSEDQIKSGTEVAVTVSAKDPGYLAYAYGVIFESATINVPVEGLPNMKKVDLADYVTCEVAGDVPNLHITVHPDLNSPEGQLLNMTDPYEDDIVRNNGETYDIELSYDKKKAEKLGYMVTNSVLTITISGQSRYILDSSDLTTDAWKTLLESTGNGIRSNYLKNANLLNDINTKFEDSGRKVLWKYFDVQPYEVVNMYAENVYGSSNIVCLVYRVTTAVVRSDDTIGTHTAYVTVNMKNLSFAEDGSLSDTGDRFDDGHGGYYVSEDELNGLPDTIKNWMQQYQDVTIIKKVTETPDLTDIAVPEKVEPGDVETASTLDLVPNESKSPDAAADIESKAAAMIEYDGHKYYRFDDFCTWEEAEEFCTKAGWHLVSIGSRKELDLMHILIDGNNNAPTTGLYWTGANLDKKKWTWTDGTEFVFNSWYNEKPYRDEETNPVALLSRNDGTTLVNTVNECEKVGFILEAYDPVASESDAAYLEESLTNEKTNVAYTVEDSFYEQHYLATHLEGANNYYASYDLDGRYGRFSGVLSAGDKTVTEADMVFAVFGDGKLLYHQTEMNRQSNGIGFAVDVTGVKTMELLLGNQTSGDAQLIIDHAKLYAAEKTVEAEQSVDLRDMTPVDGNYTRNYRELSRDNEGHWNNGGIVFEASRNAFAVWNLNCEYSRLTFAFNVPERSNASARVTINVYGDDVLLDSRSGMDKTSEMYRFPEDIDLSGVRLLKIEVIDESDAGESYGELMDCRVYPAR